MEDQLETVVVKLDDGDVLKVAGAAFACSLLACLIAIWLTRKS